MAGLPWGDIKDMVHYIGTLVLIIWAIRFMKFLIGTFWVRFCPHCHKKVN